MSADVDIHVPGIFTIPVTVRMNKLVFLVINVFNMMRFLFFVLVISLWLHYVILHIVLDQMSPTKN